MAGLAKAQCTKCLKFIVKTKMKRHLKTCQGPKHFSGQFNCSECNKTYVSKQTLVNHWGKHHDGPLPDEIKNIQRESKRPKYCDTCQKFVTHLNRHLKKVHALPKGRSKAQDKKGEPAQRELHAQREPAQREPAQREPPQREPAQREPAQREPTQQRRVQLQFGPPHQQNKLEFFVKADDIPLVHVREVAKVLRQVTTPNLSDVQVWKLISDGKFSSSTLEILKQNSVRQTSQAVVTIIKEIFYYFM
jgi:hypothetical protein